MPRVVLFWVRNPGKQVNDVDVALITSGRSMHELFTHALWKAMRHVYLHLSFICHVVLSEHAFLPPPIAGHGL